MTVWKPVCSFFVPGVPRPGGSKNAFALRNRDGTVRMRAPGAPMIVVTDSGGEKTKEWRASVAAFAKSEHLGPPVAGPLRLHVVFFMPRPKAHFRGGDWRRLKETAPEFHTSRPDATKLLRSTEDALSKLVWADDSQIAIQTAEKRYGDRPGAMITLEACA